MALPRHDRVADTTIRETPGVSGGYPCVGHTRIAVRLIVEAYRDIGSIDRVAEQYEQLTREQIDAALIYYLELPDRVDEDIERNAHAWATLTRLRDYQRIEICYRSTDEIAAGSSGCCSMASIRKRSGSIS